MVWEHSAGSIVMVTDFYDVSTCFSSSYLQGSREKCFAYFPSKLHGSRQFGEYNVCSKGTHFHNVSRFNVKRSSSLGHSARASSLSSVAGSPLPSSIFGTTGGPTTMFQVLFVRTTDS
jgi:hypothetical protein